MLVRDIMTTKVITVTSDTSIYDAQDIMRLHGIERLPVVDEGKLVGVITKDTILRAAPSPSTARSIWEFTLIVHKMTVQDVMKTHVVTISPAMTVESAVALAQRKEVGCLVVLEGDNLVGIVTTNDFFYKILNPLFGIGVSGVRISVHRCGDANDMREVLSCIEKHSMRIISVHSLISTPGEENDFIIHLDTEDASQVTVELRKMGYTVEVRPHNAEDNSP